MADDPTKKDDAPPTLDTKTTVNQDDPIFQLAVEKETNARLTQALSSRPAQDPVQPQAQPLAPLPNDPLELLNAKEREELEAIKLTSPDRYTQIYANLASRLTEMRIGRQAAPLIAAQAKSLVQAFKYDKSVTEKPEVYRQIAPIFDAMMAQVTDLSPLVNMTDAQRTTELELRWKSAKSEVLEKLASAPPPKPEPTLLSTSGPTGGSPPGSAVNDKFEDDEWVQAMKKTYNFTDEQIAELAKANA